MMIKRNKETRGLTNISWLKSKHSFSFGDYYDPEQMGFGPLRVINEDRVIPGAGFGFHPHNNMEIISYVVSGQLAHKDSMKNGSVIKPGDVQIMSAGTGVMHSEYNASNTEEVHFLQIWIMPNVRNERPNYQQKLFSPEEMHHCFRVVVSPNGEEQSLVIKQDARMLAGRFDKGEHTVVQTKSNRRYWLQMVHGSVIVNEERLSSGDGLALEREEILNIASVVDSEIILFDLP
ncbi:pirin family protein [Legionella fallonii]|uniref:Quercetin 2,3-dioxygenase n=1 Tax=Legionella fallonii LLAP-10 TaxID=1212491 RepID=A0A098G286_9GAMM|nr:pirin family protein [Legionella fallonii]CEG56079.1 conserved protein of unknown function [ Pirin domain] [Legionella fallonii LLAP-10]